MLTIGNIYGHGFDQALCAQMETLGFRIRPQISTYTGTQICRFIDFASGPALELIDVESEQAYLDFIPAGMQPYCPGISITVPALEDFERLFSHLGPYRLHINYDGSETPDKPGWNYLNFKTPLVPQTFIWLTAFDQPKPEVVHETNHPNSIIGMSAMVFDLPDDCLQALSHLAGGTKLGEVEVWSKGALSPKLPTTPDKVFPLVLVVFKAKSLDAFAGQRGVSEVTFRSRPAVLITTNRLSWDILVTT